MSRPLLLDSYCGAGGAGYGYSLAGFDVVGIDKADQPHYPFPVLKWDALEALDMLLAGEVLPFSRYGLPVRHLSLRDFTACHSSPPCQFATIYNNNRKHVRTDHPNLIPVTRERLLATGLPYVIENVPRARPWLRDPVQLCGTSFGIEVRRHRLFESDVVIDVPPCDHGRFTERKYPGSSNRPNGRTVCNIGEWRVPLAIQQAAIGIDWMTMKEISQAIPPAMTAHLARRLIKYRHVTALP
jgi:DNA (cytosine-5)-methyltransferase 1